MQATNILYFYLQPREHGGNTYSMREISTSFTTRVHTSARVVAVKELFEGFPAATDPNCHWTVDEADQTEFTAITKLHK